MAGKRFVEISDVAYRMLVQMERCYREVGFPDTVVSVAHDAIKYRYDFLVEAQLIKKPRKVKRGKS